MAMDLSALLATVKGKKAQLEAASGKNASVKPPHGSSRWRILPGWRPSEPNTFFHDFAQHWIKDATGTVVGVFVCDNKTFGRDCETCDTVNEAIRSTKDDDTIKKLKEFQGRGGVIVNALRRDGDAKSDTVPVLLQLTNGTFEDYCQNLTTAASDGVNILDLEEGRDVVITRTGTTMKDTKYGVTTAATNSKVSSEAAANLIDIDAWIDAQRRQGLSKGLNLVGDVTRALTGGHVPASRRLVPPSGAKMIASHVIEDAEVREAEVVAPKTTPKVAVKTVVASDGDLVSDEELEALMKNL